MSEQSSDAPDLGAPDEWLSAAETHRQVVAATWAPGTNLAIAQRAHAGILRSKALMLTVGQRNEADAEIPKEFWWAGGHEALTQNWKTGDFETWIDRRIHLRAIGVQFHLGDLRKVFPEIFKGDSASNSSELASAKGGRPPAEWWDDLWIEMCRALYVGDLKPKKQADIEKAMNDWISSKNESAANSTVRSRARKLWQVLSREDEN